MNGEFLMAFRQIKSPALANQAVINTKLDVTSVSGQTASNSLADLDTLLIHSNAQSALFKITASDLIGSFDTDDLAEGANQYFTDARAQAAVAADIAAAVAAEETRALAAELVLTNDLAAEVTRATTAEQTNATAIAAEETRALAAEGALDTAYKAADTNLQGQIDNIVSNTDPAALDSLTEIVTAFQAADSVFTAGIQTNATAIANEVTRATAAETTNATAIATETTDRQAADAVLTTAVQTEEAARISADNALDARVTVNEGDISTLQTDLATEIAATDGEISTLTNDLSAEVTRATLAEAANAQSITDEITARQTADTSVRADFATADAAVTTAMEAYADQAELDAVATAQSYTNQYADQVGVDAENYTDDQIEDHIGDLTVDGTSGNTITDRIATAKAGAEATAEAYTDAEVLTEKTRAEAAELTLTTNLATETARIDDIISNTDPAALDSLTEIVAAFQAADSNFQALINSNTNAITAEATARAAADTTLQGNIDSEATTRANADTTLQNNIDAEATTRAADDNAVEAAAAADATAKADAAELAAKTHADNQDTALIGDGSVDGSSGNTIKDRIDDGDATVTSAFQAADTAVRTDFAAADAAIQLQVTANAGDIATNATDIATNTSAIAQEVTDRTAGDNTLQANIDTEEAARIAADTTLTNDLAAEVTRATNAETANSTAISNEVTRATGVEAGLRTDTDTNTADIATNAAAITTEETARIAGDSNLQGQIDTEKGRIDDILSGADTALDTLKEIGDAFAAADSTLQGLITANSTRLTTNEADIATLENEMDAAEGRLDSLEAVVQATGESLDTTATTLVGAINEVHGETDTNTTNIGTIGDLDTTATNLVDAVNEVHGEVDANLSAATTDRAAIRTEFAAADNVVRSEFAAEDTNIRGEFAAADTALDTSLKAYADQAEADAITAAETYTDAEVLTEKTRAMAAELVNTNAIAAEATTARAAEQANATGIANNLAEITATQSSAGLNTDGTYTAHSGSNYIDAASNLKAVDLLLDAAVKANETALAQEVTDRTADVDAEETRATGEEARIEGLVTTEVTRATNAEAGIQTQVTANAAAILAEETRATGEETRIEAKADNIISNTDPAALDSLTEIVTAFQAADSTLTGLVTANQTDIATNASDIAQEIVDRAAEDTSIRNDFAAADTTLQANIDLKVAKSGDTMSGDLAMGGNMVSGLGSAVNNGDAVSKAFLDAAIAAQDISVYDTDDLAEGSTNLYFTDARALNAINTGAYTFPGASGNEGQALRFDANGDLVVGNVASEVLGLDDVSDSNYTSKAGYVLSVDENEGGMSLVDPSTLSFATPHRQVINGDGSQTVFALNFYSTVDDAMVFVGGVIQDPTTHYTLDGSGQQITFNSAIPVGTQAVVISHQIVNVPFIAAASVTSDKFASDVKAYVQQAEVTASTGGDTVDTFNGTAYRSAKYIIQVDDGGGEYETREALVVHDGTNAYITEYALVYTGSALIGDASVTMNGNNVELVYTVNSGTATVKVISTYIDV